MLLRSILILGLPGENGRYGRDSKHQYGRQVDREIPECQVGLTDTNNRDGNDDRNTDRDGDGLSPNVLHALHPSHDQSVWPKRPFTGSPFSQFDLP